MSSNEIEFLIYGVLLTIFTLLASGYIRRVYFIAKYIYQAKRNVKEARQRVEKYRKEGNLHKWVELPTKIDGTGLVKVCSETGWCPSKDEFYSVELIKHVMDGMKIKKSYEEFREKAIVDIAFDHIVRVSDVKSIVEAVADIDNKFFSKRREELLKREEING